MATSARSSAVSEPSPFRRSSALRYSDEGWPQASRARSMARSSSSVISARIFSLVMALPLRVFRREISRSADTVKSPK